MFNLTVLPDARAHKVLPYRSQCKILVSVERSGKRYPGNGPSGPTPPAAVCAASARPYSEHLAPARAKRSARQPLR